jgi:hypothetical protein
MPPIKKLEESPIIDGIDMNTQQQSSSDPIPDSKCENAN